MFVYVTKFGFIVLTVQFVDILTFCLFVCLFSLRAYEMCSYFITRVGGFVSQYLPIISLWGVY